MDLQSMRAAMEKARKSVTIEVPELGGPLTLRQLDAMSGMAVGLMLGGKEVSQLSAEESTAFFALLISRSVVGDDGLKPLDSDEGRAFIAEWPFATLIDVGTAAAQLNGLGDSAGN